MAITVQTYTPKRTPGAPIPVALWYTPLRCPDCGAKCRTAGRYRRHVRKHEAQRLDAALMAVR